MNTINPPVSLRLTPPLLGGRGEDVFSCKGGEREDILTSSAPLLQRGGKRRGVDFVSFLFKMVDK